MIGDDLSQLILDVIGLDWLPTDSGQRFGSRLKLALLDKVPR